MKKLLLASVLALTYPAAAFADYAWWEEWLGLTGRAYATQDRTVDRTAEFVEDDSGEGKCPKPAAPVYRWRPWQQAWQCNDIRLIVTSRDQGLIEYDVAGSIWGGARFAVDFRPRSGGPDGAYWFNGRPCARLQ